MRPRPTFSFAQKMVVCCLFFLLFISGCSSQTNPPPSSADPKTPAAEETLEVVQTATPSPTKTPQGCNDSLGTVLDESIPSDILKEDLNFKVYLPACYSSSEDIQFSVLYMLHGQTSFDDQWVRIGLLTAMDQLIDSNQIHPFIIVLPNETKTNLDSFSSKYDEVILSELIPHIEKTYRVCREKECRAIGGLSRGGNWAVHLGFTHPEVFTAIGAHSAPLFYGEMGYITLAVSDLETLASLPVFYVDVGNKDQNLDEVQGFNSILQEYNIQHQFNEFVGYHDERYWSNHVQDYLVWYSEQISQ